MSSEQLKILERPGLLVAKSLISAGCVHLNFKKPFRFSSGIKSPIRVNCERLEKNPADFEQVVEVLEDTIRSTFFDFNFLCGVIRGGVPFAHKLSERFEVSLISRVGKKQDEERKTSVKGEITPHSKGLIIEDVLTTGENSAICAEQIRAEGGVVLGVVAIFDYGFGKVRETLANCGLLKRWYLTSFNQLQEVGQQNGKFSNLEVERLRKWWAKTNLQTLPNLA